MASQQTNPTEGPSSTTANAKSDKAKKWAAFRAQNYDGEGWGEDFGDDGGSPPRPPAAVPSRPGPSPSRSSPEVVGFASTLPPSVVSNLSSAQNGSRASLPSQVTSPRVSTDLSRGIVVSGGTVPAKRAEGRDSPNRRSWVEQRSASPKPIQHHDSQECRDDPDAPTAPIPEADESSVSLSERRFSRSPQLPDLARMSMFGDDLFKGPLLSEEPPPPMPSMPSPSTLGGAGLGVNQPGATGGGASTPGSTAAGAQQTPPQITSASPSPSPAERSASPGDTAAQDRSAATQSDSAADSNIPHQGSVSSPVSEGAKTPNSQQAASTLSLSGMAGQVTAPAESTSNVSSLDEPSATELTRKPSPSPLRSTSPAEPTLSSQKSPQEDASADAASAEYRSADDNASDPAPLAERTTTSTTTSSAPRQCDILREEIIKSLGRAASTGEEDDSSAHQRQSTLDSGIRESTYLPAVYDDYWATTAEGKDDVPEVPSLPPAPAGEVAVAPLRPGSKSPDAQSPQPLRQRFSWERSSEGGSGSPMPQPRNSEAHDEPPTDASRPPAAESSSPGQDRSGSRAEPSEDTDAEEEEVDVSRNESEASKATAVDPNAEPKRLSLAAEKGLTEGTPTEHLLTEPTEDHPALRDEPKDSSGDATPKASPKGSPKMLPRRQSVKTLSFREIMALATSQERAAKFEETRLQYAAMDQGLDSWIISLKAQPEHERASAIFNANGAAVPAAAPSAKGQTETSPTTGQPYNQQYLNASSAQSGVSGRAASAGVSSASPAASAFKHSSNQAGVKSKELLFAAGKAGKGLLNKGKNKLRGSTGDKKEAAPPQPQPKAQTVRSASSGAKIGAGGSSATPPADPQSTPASPNAAPHNSPATKRPSNGTLPSLQPPPAKVSAGNPDLVSPISDANSRVLSSDGDEVGAPQGKTNAPAGGKPQPWTPMMGSPLADGERRDTAEGGAGATRNVKGDDKSDDRTVVSPQQIQQSSEQADGQAESFREEAASKNGEISTNAAGQDSVDKTDDKARPPSFAGLPPIRRASTFEPAFGDRPEEAGENNGATSAPESQVDELPTITDMSPSSEATSKDEVESKTLEGQTLGNDNVTTEGQLLDLVKQKSMIEQTGKPGTLDDQPATREDPAANTPTVEEPATEKRSSLPPAGPGLDHNMPEHMTANPIQTPPPGQWNLQESYLSEPLISPSRKRPTSPSSRAESTLTEFDKEVDERASAKSESSDDGSVDKRTGEEASKPAGKPQESGDDAQQGQPQTESAQPPPAVNAPTGVHANKRAQPVPPGPRPGQKYGATPPVSMQRYRGLFAPRQPPGQAYGQPGRPAPSQSNSTEGRGALPNSSADPRPRSSSRPRTADDKGRRSSGIFSQIGERFAKMNPQGEANDTSSETGDLAPEQRQRRRSSFFLNLKKGAAEEGPKSGDSKFANPPSTLEDRSLASASPEESPKKSFFDVKGITSTGGTGRFIPPFNRSSTGPEDGMGGKRFIPVFARRSTSADEDGREGRARFIPAFSRSSTANAEEEGKEGKTRFMPTFSRPSMGTEEDGKDGKPRLIPSFSRSSTATAEEDGREGKSRFGGLGMFRRGTGQESQEKPGSSGSMVSSLQSRPVTGTPTQPGAPVQTQTGQPHQSARGMSLPLPPARGRSGTTGSMPSMPSLLAQANSPPEERGRKISGPGAFLSNIWHNRSSSRSKERKAQQPQAQFGPTGPTGLSLGTVPPSGQQAPPPLSLGKPQTPVHQRRTSAPSSTGSPNLRPPTHLRQVSVPENSSPLSRKSGTSETSPTKGPLGQVPPVQPATLSASPQAQSPQSPSRVDQAEQERQDWRPISAQQQAEAGTGFLAQEDAPATGTSEGPSSGDGEEKGDPVGKPDAPTTETKAANEGGVRLATPTESGGTNAVQDAGDGVVARDASETPKAERPPSIREPTDKDGGPTMPAIKEPEDAGADIPSINERKDTDASPSLPSTNEAAKLPSAPTSRSPTPQEAYGRRTDEDQAKSPQAEVASASGHTLTRSARGASTSSVASVESTPSRSEGGVALTGNQVDSVSAATPQLSSPAPSHVHVDATSTGSRASVGWTVSPDVSSAVAPATAPAQEQAQVPQTQPPQEQRPADQVPSPSVTGQQAQDQPPYVQPLQAGAQGQWRPYMPNQAPVAGHQPQPTTPGFQGQSVPPPVWNASTSQNTSAVQFQSAPGLPAQQPQQPEQRHNGVSKWFKGITSSQNQQQQQPQYRQQAPQQQQSVQSKVEKSAKSLLGAFKRASKTNAAKPPTSQPHAAQSPAAQAPFTQQAQPPGFVFAGYPQQYGQPQYVMHPQWGMVPVQPGYGLRLQPGQQFVPAPFPGAFQPMLYAPGQAPFQSYMPNQSQSPSIPSSRQTSVASTQPQSAASQSGSPAVQGPSVVPQTSAGSQPTIKLVPQPTASAEPQSQGTTGPQSSGNQNSDDPSKPLDVPAVVSTESHAAQPPTTESSKTVAALEQAARTTKFAGNSREGSQASLKPEDARKLTLDTETAGRKSDETNLYDATPRGGIGTEGTTSAVQSPLKSPGQLPPAPREDMNGSVATHSTQSTEPTTQSTEPTTQGTQDTGQAKPAESKQQEMIRKMRLEAQSEKILVPGQEGLPGTDEEPEDPDKPKMSATSYPGQEWNPYGGYELYY